METCTACISCKYFSKQDGATWKCTAPLPAWLERWVGLSSASDFHISTKLDVYASAIVDCKAWKSKQEGV